MSRTIISLLLTYSLLFCWPMDGLAAPQTQVIKTTKAKTTKPVQRMQPNAAKREVSPSTVPPEVRSQPTSVANNMPSVKRPLNRRERASTKRQKNKLNAPAYAEVLHTPRYQIVTNRKFEVAITVRGEWHVQAVSLHYRVVGQPKYRKVLFLRGEQTRYYAVVPKVEVTSPGLEYYIDSTDRQGRSHLHYATPVRPHLVKVRRPSPLGIWLAKLGRHQNTRSTVGLMMELNSYGTHAGLRFSDSPGASNQLVLDAFYNLELWYTYRILGVFYQITVGYGRLRGDVPLDGNLTGAADTKTIQAGLDYGFSRLYLEFHKYFGLELKLVLGASDRGFDGGGGATFRIGNLVETHLDIGFELISRLGWTVFFELAWDTVPWFMLALRAEVTTMPFFDERTIAARGYLKALAKIHKHFHMFLHIGYGRRRTVPLGGPLLQVGVMSNF